ncbi:MAG: fimbria/pilus outer membrane usher protein [Verrucomicrobia subdivision 3 bacterium]|nr:fimbria/pilus outer membrane usher protein [Limisphaerales bacterium]
MARRYCGWGSRPSLWNALLALGLLLSTAGGASAGPDSKPLWLEVVLNGYATKLAAQFFLDSGSKLSIAASELKEIGLTPPETKSGTERIELDAIPGLSYRYDAQRQLIEIDVPPAAMLRRTISARGESGALPKPQSSLGAVLNYGLLGSLYGESLAPRLASTGASAQLDGRLFSDWGTLESSGIVGTTAFSQFSMIRLATAWSTSDPETLVTWRAGDTISGGLPWTRPIRMAGLQVQRNFGLRPDLITMPLPSFSAGAAVPSTVDVFMNNVKTYSRDLPAGMFTITGMPVFAGPGMARMVLTDVRGQNTETTVGFFASPRLLRKGLFDFSAEAGFARHYFGTESTAYGAPFLASGTARYGVSDALTLESHAEGGAGLVNAGMGFVCPLAAFGALSLAGSLSHYNGAPGSQFYGAIDLNLLGFPLRVSSLRNFGAYNDIAGVSGQLALRYAPIFYLGNARPAKAIDTISLGVPLPWDGASLNLGYLHYETAANNKSSILYANLAQRLTDRISVFATGNVSPYQENYFGMFAGVSVSLGELGYGSAGLANDPSGLNWRADLVKPASLEPGSFGWRLRKDPGAITNRYASLSYRGENARTEVSASQFGQGKAATAYLDGAVALMGDGIFFSNRIDDSFAVVDTGAPDVEVFSENRRVGKTNAKGKLLVPGLRSYQSNKISIDPANLPVNAEIPATSAVAVPADRSGVFANFKIRTSSTSAIVVFRSSDGRYLPAGARGIVEATNEEFVVGYDGRAFIRNLSDQNAITVELDEGSCTASFPFAPVPDEQVLIEDVICR